MAEDDLSQLKRVVQQAVETIKQVNGDPITTAIPVKPEQKRKPLKLRRQQIWRMNDDK